MCSLPSLVFFPDSRPPFLLFKEHGVINDNFGNFPSPDNFHAKLIVLPDIPRKVPKFISLHSRCHSCGEEKIVSVLSKCCLAPTANYDIV